MMKATVTILKGLPASGKSTWAKEQVEKQQGKAKRINKDDLRVMLDEGKHSRGREAFILEARNALILAAISAGFNVFVDDTNLHEKHERDIRALVGDSANIVIQDFTHVDVETCIERDRKRPNYVGERAIRQMYRDYIQPKPPIITYNIDLPDAIICDMDGTLALMNGRNPYDASTCEQDVLNEPVADILRDCSNGDTYWEYMHNRFRRDYHPTILLVSGRKECYRPQTEAWLQKHGIHYTHLWMRADGDNRKDTFVKQDIYERHIRDQYNVRFVLDDRDQVVRFWRSVGLTCLQVAEGDF